MKRKSVIITKHVLYIVYEGSGFRCSSVLCLYFLLFSKDSETYWYICVAWYTYAFKEMNFYFLLTQNYTAEVLHLPLFGAVVCEEFILAPSFASLYPLAASDVKQIAHQFSTRNHGKVLLYLL